MLELPGTVQGTSVGFSFLAFHGLGLVWQGESAESLAPLGTCNGGVLVLISSLTPSFLLCELMGVGSGGRWIRWQVYISVYTSSSLTVGVEREEFH